MLSTLTLLMTALGSQCLHGPCAPGNDFCGAPFADAPVYHLMDQHGCGENDPNGPVFDPVHGVIHHFYQIHLATGKGGGPDYGHFVSKDFIHWADVRTAIWNGIEVTSKGIRPTPYDNEAIYTGSATVVDGAGPGGKGPGVVNIYPGLCNAQDWPACKTGTLLAMAVPDDYSDELLINWSKPLFNPIIENTQRDPASPWREPSGEWRLRTYDSTVYGSASDADFLAGKWYEIGVSKDFRTCECPSFYPLPGASPGFEAEYAAALADGTLPTHVHKTSCGGDWWQLGSYAPGAPKVLGNFTATPGWEDMWAQRRIDVGNFYASKDNTYPTKVAGVQRRINWGWATVPPASAQTLPREITFNAAARQMQQYPIDELAGLRGAPAYTGSNVAVGTAGVGLKVAAGVAQTSEVVATFEVPAAAVVFGVTVGSGPGPAPGGKPVTTFMKGTDLAGGDYAISHHPSTYGAAGCEAACDADAKCQAWTWVVRGDGAAQGSGDCCLKDSISCPAAVAICTSGAKKNTTVNCGGGGGGPSVSCSVDYAPSANASAAFNPVKVSCGGMVDTVNLLPSEKTIEIRVFTDVTFAEVYFQGGRAAMTTVVAAGSDADVTLSASAAVTASSVTVYPLKQVWTTADAVRAAPRVYT